MMGIRLKLATIQAMIVATAILDNIVCDEKERTPVNHEQEIAINNINNIPVQNAERDIIRINANNRTRHNFIYNYFATL